MELHKKVREHIGVENVGASLYTPNNDPMRPLAVAKWVVVGDDKDVDDQGWPKSVLHGELAVPANLTPTFDFGPFEKKVSAPSARLHGV